MHLGVLDLYQRLRLKQQLTIHLAPKYKHKEKRRRLIEGANLWLENNKRALLDALCVHISACVHKLHREIARGALLHLFTQDAGLFITLSPAVLFGNVPLFYTLEFHNGFNEGLFIAQLVFILL